MIFTPYNDNLFYIDIMLHLLFSFLMLTIIFITKIRKEKQKELVKKVKSVLKYSNVSSEISDPNNDDKTALKILDSIYNNADVFDKVTNKDIEKASYNQIIVFAIALVVVVYFSDEKSRILSLLIEKLIVFSIIGSVIYLYSYYFRERYTEITEQQIYDMLKESNKNLKTTTTY